MKICVFSDVHGNSIAWQNMYRKEKDSVDKFLFLGDIYGYFYDQAAIIKDFMENDNIIAIKGNHDEYYIKNFLNLTGAELKEVDEVVDYAEDIWSELVNKYGCSYRQRLDKQYKQYLLKLPDSMSKKNIIKGFIHINYRISSYFCVRINSLLKIIPRTSVK